RRRRFVVCSSRIDDEPRPRVPVLRSARVSVAVVFFIHGLLVSNWLARIPAVQADLRLSSGVLGLALLGASAGAFAPLFGIPRLLIRFGSARVTTWSSFGLCAVL